MNAAAAETATIEQQALTTVEKARAIVVTTSEQRTMAAEIGRGIAQLDKEAEAFFAPMKQKAHEVHREICAKESTVRKPLEEAKRYLSSQIGGYDSRVERDRRVEEAKLQEAARIVAEAEAKQVADEQALQDAIELEAAGDSKGAEAVLANPTPVAVYVPPVILPKMTPKAEGVTASQVWTFRITDENAIPREYLMVDEKKLGQIVRALKNKTAIAGIEAYPVNGARFRA